MRGLGSAPGLPLGCATSWRGDQDLGCPGGRPVYTGPSGPASGSGWMTLSDSPLLVPLLFAHNLWPTRPPPPPPPRSCGLPVCLCPPGPEPGCAPCHMVSAQ